MTAMPKYVDSLRKPEDRHQVIFVRLNVELIIWKMNAQTVSKPQKVIQICSILKKNVPNHYPELLLIRLKSSG